MAVLTDRCDESMMAWVHADNEHGPNAPELPAHGQPPTFVRESKRLRQEFPSRAIRVIRDGAWY